MKFVGENPASDATELVGGPGGMAVVLCAAVGVGCTSPKLSVATL
ncbi:MAG TPA: hypothetical protein VGX78_20615 [Pirellulales bacterium]|nr:hypothetical protein [Pirellulales bacterium]